MSIEINLDLMLVKRDMSLTELSKRLGITISHMSNIKNGKIKSLNLDTLDALCRELDCQPGELLEYK